ncbi:MAG: pyroglutamyl-peptidase I [Candidatus Eremiobacteraeota bacterium]|nr:pyroglutamyl-peptidase I [Candidatus Eremiobacteraeota bacterium]
MARRVLIAGFEPFGGDKINPGEMVARSLEGRTLAGRTVAVRIIPVETRNVRERFERALVEDDPDVVIALSQFGGRTALSMERVAVNVLDFEYPDNVGVMRKADVVSRGGADARLSNLPFDRIIEAWTANGVPGYVSNSAGTFIGNQALYEILGLTEHASPPVVAGVVHLPYLPAQAIAAGSESNPSMTLELMKKGVEILIETIVPWVEQRTPEATKARAQGKSTWIPRGVKEVER